MIKNNAKIDLQSGKSIDIINPNTSDIDIEDIANGLANKGHFIGHTPKYFSIAEHCIMVAYLSNRLEGLLHDGSEAYLSDIASPLKKLLPDYKIYEIELMYCIGERFDLDYVYLFSSKLKQYDLQVLAYEFDRFFPNKENPFIEHLNLSFEEVKVNLNKINISYLTPHQSKKMFLKTFRKLNKKKNLIYSSSSETIL